MTTCRNVVTPLAPEDRAQLVELRRTTSLQKLAATLGCSPTTLEKLLDTGASKEAVARVTERLAKLR